MAYRQATKLPDRYKVVFHNDATGDRQRIFIDAVTFSPIKNMLDLEAMRSDAIRHNDKSAQRNIERLLVDAYEIAAETDRVLFDSYSPGPDYRMWYVPFIETFDTTSGDLEVGQVWEGANRHGVDVVVWKDESGNRKISKASDVVVTRKDGIPETIERKV